MPTKLKLDNEIIALLQLVDDPDPEVYDVVSQKILAYGTAVIPHLEQLWEFADESLAQTRIEELIHQAQYQQLQTELLRWAKLEKPSLLDAGLIISKYRYPELDKEMVLHEFELMRRNIWLELNNFLSPLEQINIINGIIFNFFRIHGHELTVHDPKHFFISEAIESRQGNAFTIGILYMTLCEMLDVPIFAIDVPNQFVMAYYEETYSFLDDDQRQGVVQLQFFIDPINGMVYSRNDIKMYLRKHGKTDIEKSFRPLDNHDFMRLMLQSLANTYSNLGDGEKAIEIESLISLLLKKND